MYKKYTSSHSAVRGEAMKQELQRRKSGSSKKKEMKTEGTVRAEASQNKMSKKTIINKGENKKSLSSSSQEAKRRKESKEGQEKMSSGKIFPVQPPSKGTNAESRKQKPDMMLKIPKATAVSAITSTKKPSVGSNTSSKPEQGNNKKQKESGTHEKLKPKSPNSKVEARERNHGSFSKKAAPSGSRSQTQIATLKEPRPSSQVTSLAEKSGEPNVRRLKIMRALGLIPPAASPFVKTGAHL